MKQRSRTALLTILFGLLIAPGSGCLSLSLLNRDNVDTRQRVDALERRVTALEAAGVHQPTPPAATLPYAEPPVGRAIEPSSQFQPGYPPRQ